MKTINLYILEKFKINKNIKGEEELYKKYFPTDKEYSKIKEIFFQNGYQYGYSDYVCEKINNHIKSPISKFKYWLAILDYSNSIPYKFKDFFIHTTPGRYGEPFISDILDDLELEIEDILHIYEVFNESSYKRYNTLPEDINKLYKSKIKSLLHIALPEIENDIKITYKLDDINNFSELGLKVIDKQKSLIVIPFELEYKGKTINCEIIYSGNTYYNYKLEDNNYKLHKDFCEKLREKFGF